MLDAHEVRKQFAAYVERVGVPISTLGRRITGEPNAAKNFLNGKAKKPQQRTLEKFVAFMKDHPDGGTRQVRQNRIVDAVMGQSPYRKGAEPISDPCPFCGIRGELGCKHRRPWGPIASFIRVCYL